MNFADQLGSADVELQDRPVPRRVHDFVHHVQAERDVAEVDQTRVDSSAGSVPAPIDKVITSGTKSTSTSPPRVEHVARGIRVQKVEPADDDSAEQQRRQPGRYLAPVGESSLRTAAQASAPAVNCMTMRGSQLHGV